MDNKPNQQNANSASSSAATTPLNTTTSASDTSSNPLSTAASSASQPSAGGAKQARKSAQTTDTDNNEGASNTTASTAVSSQPQDTERKSWLNQEELLKNVNLNQLPQSVKDFGSKAVDQFNSLSTQQKVIGGALLVSGLSWLALRSKKAKASSDIYAPYNPKKAEDAKWQSSNESVYRGASAGLHNSDTVYGTENGF